MLPQIVARSTLPPLQTTLRLTDAGIVTKITSRGGGAVVTIDTYRGSVGDHTTISYVVPAAVWYDGNDGQIRVGRGVELHTDGTAVTEIVQL